MVVRALSCRVPHLSPRRRCCSTCQSRRRCEHSRGLSASTSPPGTHAAVRWQWLRTASLWLSPFTECCSFFRDDTHKVDVINFAQSKATKCLQNENLLDKESASLLWNFIVLLCRQNGVRVFLPLEQPLSLTLSLRNPWSPGSWAGFPCRAVHGEWRAVQLLLGRSVLAVIWGRGRETGVQLGGRKVRVPMSACQVRLAPGCVGSGSVSSW